MILKLFEFLTLLLIISDNTVNTQLKSCYRQNDNRIPIAVITDKSIEEYFGGDISSADFAIFKQFEGSNDVFAKQNFTYIDFDNTEYTYSGYGFTLGLIVHNPEDINDLNYLKNYENYDASTLARFLLGSFYVQNLMNEYIVAFVTTKKIIGFNGFSLGTYCSDGPVKNVIAISFYECKIDGQNLCNVTLHELSHQLGATDIKHSNKECPILNLMSEQNNNLEFCQITKDLIGTSIYNIIENHCFQPVRDQITSILCANTNITLSRQKMLDRIKSSNYFIFSEHLDKICGKIFFFFIVPLFIIFLTWAIIVIHMDANNIK